MSTTRLWLSVAVMAMLPLQTMAQDGVSLNGSEWRLELIDGKPLPPNAEVTAAFADGRVTGKAAVNRYFASCTINDEAIALSEIGSTKMAGPQDLMAVENSYLETLKAVRTYRLTDGKLELCDAAGTCRLVFARADAGSELTGHEWRLETFDGERVPADAEITATFADGRIAGKAAVNRYFASYTTDGQALTFGEAGSTLMAGPEHLMALERAYLQALKAIRTYRLADGKLELWDGAGVKRLVFGRGEPGLEIIDPGAPLYLEEGMVWVPMRALAEWMGAIVSWDAAGRTATATLGDREFAADGRANVARGAGQEWRPKWRMLRPSGLMYVPLKALASSLGAEIVTQPDDHVLIIASGGRRGTLSAP